MRTGSIESRESYSLPSRHNFPKVVETVANSTVQCIFSIYAVYLTVYSVGKFIKYVVLKLTVITLLRMCKNKNQKTVYRRPALQQRSLVYALHYNRNAQVIDD